MDIGNTRWLVKSVIPDSVATVIATAKACIIMIVLLCTFVMLEKRIL